MGEVKVRSLPRSAEIEADDVSRDARDMLFGGILLILTVTIGGWLTSSAREEENWIFGLLLNFGLVLLPLRHRSAISAFGMAFAWVLFAGLVGYVLYDDLWAGVPLEQRSWVFYGMATVALGSIGLSVRDLLQERRAKRG